MTRKYQAATGIYTKNDILHLKITEEEREELLNLHIKAEHQKQNDDPRASDRRLSEKSCLATFSQREQAFFVSKKRFLNIMSGEELTDSLSWNPSLNLPFTIQPHLNTFH